MLLKSGKYTGTSVLQDIHTLPHCFCGILRAVRPFADTRSHYDIL